MNATEQVTRYIKNHPLRGQILHEARREEVFAIYIGGSVYNDGKPRAVQVDNNPPGIAIRAGKSSALEASAISKSMNQYSPHWRQAVIFRIWTTGKHYAGRLEKLIKRKLVDVSDPVMDPRKRSWRILRSDADLVDIEVMLIKAAIAEKIPVWTDKGMIQFLEQSLKEEQLRRALT